MKIVIKNKDNTKESKILDLSEMLAPIIEPIMEVLLEIEELQNYEDRKAIEGLVTIFVLIVALERKTKDREKAFDVLREMIYVY